MATRFSTRLLSVPVLLLALGGTLYAGELFRRDLLFTRLETEVGFWGRGDYQPRPETIQRTGRSLNTLVESAPNNPLYLALQANYAAWRGFWSEDPALGQQFTGRAIAAQRASLESRPAHRQSWVKMLQYASRYKEGGEARALAKARLAALQPDADPS